MLFSNQELEKEKNTKKKRADFEIKYNRGWGILESLSQEYGFDYIIDGYSDESGMPFSVRNASEENAVGLFSSLFQRDFVIIDGIYVFRHVKGAGRTLEELRHRSLYPCDWPISGKISVKKIPASQKLALPRVDMIADAITFALAAQAFSKELGWKIRIDPELAERRFFARIRQAAPSQIIEVMMVLLQGNQQVTISQSPEQKIADRKAAEDAMDQRSTRAKGSDKIRADLEKLLTPEQFAQLDKGTEVALSVKNLPAGLKTRVIDYIRSNTPSNSNADLSRMQEFEIVFLPLPMAPTGVFGVNGFTTEGIRLGY
jgi:hypothetical protein